MELYAICRAFVDKVNERIAEKAIQLDPPAFTESDFDEGGTLFQINLRGRLLQMEFAATEELYENDDFRKQFVLRGKVRGFNQDLLAQNTVDEQLIFYCPAPGGAEWHHFDERTYRTGRVGEDYLVSEMERLL